MSGQVQGGCVASFTAGTNAGLMRADAQEKFFGKDMNLGLHRNPIQFTKKHYIKAVFEHIGGPFVSAVKVVYFALKLIYDLTIAMAIKTVKGGFKGAVSCVGKDFESIGRNIIGMIPIFGAYLLDPYAYVMAKISGEKPKTSSSGPIAKPPVDSRVTQTLTPVAGAEISHVSVEEIGEMFDCMHAQTDFAENLAFVRALFARDDLINLEVPGAIVSQVINRLEAWIKEDVQYVKANAARRGKDFSACMEESLQALFKALKASYNLAGIRGATLEMNRLLCQSADGLPGSPAQNTFRNQHFEELEAIFGENPITLGTILRLYQCQFEDDQFWGPTARAAASSVNEIFRFTE